VNPTTGVFTSGSPELFAAFAPETVTLASASSLTASYKVSMPDVVNEGTGVWTVTPEPSSGVLVGVGTIVAWGLGFRRRA
jgi:hypothetical protein